MPTYRFEITVPSIIPRDVLTTAVKNMMADLVRKYGVVEVNVNVRTTSPGSNIELQEEEEGGEEEGQSLA